MCEWLAAQNSDQLCSYTLDVFKNVFFTTNDIQNAKRDNLFFLKAKIEKIGRDNPQVVLYEDAFRSFFTKWGLTLDTLPDYSNSIRKLGHALVKSDNFNSASGALSIVLSKFSTCLSDIC